MSQQTTTLFDLAPAAPTSGARICVFKAKHGIFTYRTPGMSRKDHPWIALKPLPEDADKTCAEIVASSCRLYEERGLLVTGEGELTAIRELCRVNKIVCTL